MLVRGRAVRISIFEHSRAIREEFCQSLECLPSPVFSTPLHIRLSFADKHAVASKLLMAGFN